MTVQEVGDEIGKLGFVPEWRWSEDSQQWVHPQTRVRLSVRWLDGCIKYRRIGTSGGVFSEYQTDSANYGSLARALEDPCK